MKILLLSIVLVGLLSVGLIYASDMTPTQKFRACLKSCCDKYGGDWKYSHCYMDRNDPNFEAYYACESECIDYDYGYDEDCLSAYVLMALLGLVFIKT